MKIKEKSLENLNEALDLLKKELNDETNGNTQRCTNATQKTRKN